MINDHWRESTGNTISVNQTTMLQTHHQFMNIKSKYTIMANKDGSNCGKILLIFLICGMVREPEKRHKNFITNGLACNFDFESMRNWWMICERHCDWVGDSQRWDLNRVGVELAHRHHRTYNIVSLTILNIVSFEISSYPPARAHW